MFLFMSATWSFWHRNSWTTLLCCSYWRRYQRCRPDGIACQNGHR